ncbi:MAG: pyruvate kinase [Candidatus Brocadiales bacterium]|nr:pyruvate kinase [Candidatus Bathyanammoxibius amoris]
MPPTNKMLRKTKIVCTIGPASSSPKVLRDMALAGMNVARLNFSHGSYEDHAKAIARIRRISASLKRPIAVMQDLPGPKIRTGRMESESVTIRKGGRLVITGKDVEGCSERVSVNFPGFIKKIRPGAAILIDDGKIRLKVTGVRRDKKEISCSVLEGGLLGEHKGVNLPDTDLDIDALTGADRKCVTFGLSQGVDLIALSFVGSARDIHIARRFIASKGGGDIPVIAKIERRQALDNLDEILEAADGVMVARGDLGVETELEDVPLVQKRIIRSCVTMGKPVITATQMLESMVERSSPTRAEVADVANAVLDGTDALMLSEETAVGRFPVRCVRMMDKVARKAESTIDHEKLLAEEQISEDTIEDAITHGANMAAMDVRARAIIACTNTGKTARLVSRYRSEYQIIGASPYPDVVNRLCVTWGVYPVRMKKVRSADEMMKEAEKAALKTGLVKRGDTIVITAGYPNTNMLKTYRIGHP